MKLRLRRSPARVVTITATAVLVAVPVAVTGVVWAAASPGDEVHACVHKHLGTVRIIDPARKQRCLSSFEKAISWNKTGPAGQAGQAGPQGPAGNSGASVVAQTKTRGHRLDIAPNSIDRHVVECLTGEVATGGGYISTSRGVVVTSSYPFAPGDKPKGWEVVAENTSGTQQSVYMSVICVPTQ